MFIIHNSTHSGRHFKNKYSFRRMGTRGLIGLGMKRFPLRLRKCYRRHTRYSPNDPHSSVQHNRNKAILGRDHVEQEEEQEKQDEGDDKRGDVLLHRMKRSSPRRRGVNGRNPGPGSRVTGHFVKIAQLTSDCNLCNPCNT